MTRRRVIAGNWKMYKTVAETRAFFSAFAPLCFVAQRQAATWSEEDSVSSSFPNDLLLLGKLLTLIAIPIRWAKPHDYWIVIAIPVVFLAIVTVVAAVKVWPKSLPKPSVALTWAVGAAGVAFAMTLSLTREPLAIHYVAFLLVPFLAFLFAAFAAFDSIVQRRLAHIWLALGISASLITLAVDYTPLAKTGDWYRVASYVMRAEQPGEPILVFQAEAAQPLRYYYHGENQLVPVPRPLNMQTYDLRELVLKNEADIANAIASAPGKHRNVWVVTTDYCQTISLYYNCPLFESYLAKHYIVVRQVSFYQSTLRQLERRQSAGRSAVSGRHEALENVCRPSAACPRRSAALPVSPFAFERAAPKADGTFGQ